MITSERVIINANCNRKYWTDKGYEFETYKDARGVTRTKLGSEIEVLVSDLPIGSHTEVKVKCDYCGRDYKAKYKLIIRSRKEVMKDACQDCQKHKRADVMLYRHGNTSAMRIDKFKEKAIKTNNERYGVDYVGQSDAIKEKIKKTNNKKYGVDWTFQAEVVKDKIKNTVLNKYGVENVMFCEDIKQRIINTNNERYGVDFYMQTDDYKNKSRQTNLELYGYEHAFQSPKIKEKIKETMLDRYGVEKPMDSDVIKDRIKATCLEKYGETNYTKTNEYKNKVITTNREKYGVDWVLQSPNVREKIVKTLFQNGNVPTSRQQTHLCDLLGGILNQPIKWYNADIVLEKESIVIEYDGGGHDLQVKLGDISSTEFYKKQTKRDYVFYSEGYKIIRIISESDKLLKDEVFIKLLDIAKEYFNQGRHWVEINIDNNQWKCSQFTSNLDELLNN